MIGPSFDAQLCSLLKKLPEDYENRYSDASRQKLVEILFRSLAAWKSEYLDVLFPHGPPPPGTIWSLKSAQGAVEGAEYTEAARGHPCGHIFKAGEATYRCKTCTDDDTCVLCSRCYDASDHEGHTVYVSMSPGNSGCCDCGDAEAWNRPVNCTIHTCLPGTGESGSGKAKTGSPLPADLVASIRSTIARSLDYFCDVWSCSPEQLRLPKTVESVKEDEHRSRLVSQPYGEDDSEDTEFALVLWNDEKHTVNDVKDVVSRACRTSSREGINKAHEVDDVGRSVLVYSKDVESLLRMAKIIEQPKLTVTIRSARDTFREAMCETIIEWVLDIAGCSIGPDPEILRSTICEELLGAWRIGSSAHHKAIGEDGIDDHEVEDMADEYLQIFGRPRSRLWPHVRRAQQAARDNTVDESDETDQNADEDVDMMDVEGFGVSSDREELDITDNLDDALEESEATMAGYPPPPPPPQGSITRIRMPGDLNGDEETIAPPMVVPKTPKIDPNALRHPVTARYWLERPEAYGRGHDVPLCEDLWQRVRLDFLILYDMRMWKKLRSDIRDVLIGTVVTTPYFKRMLGLRFAGVYTVLAELYLIADREPDHSIVNLSLQMLTTPSITVEVVERGNFLTNLMAILYTFLTTRQVGYPTNVNLRATLEFDQGAVGNRRIYQFYHDMQHLLASEQVQVRIRTEERYLLQFMDLVKLHQGICPNERQVGEHVEYEADAWIQASVITSEIMKLGRKLAEAFTVHSEEQFSALCRAIRTTACMTTINCLGAERSRFEHNEIKAETKFRSVNIPELTQAGTISPTLCTVVEYVVANEPMSFHHALHYTLSWLIDKGKSMSATHLRQLLMFTTHDLRQLPAPLKSVIPEHDPEENLLALFDFPIRVCAWLAQMKAGMWVRNGITLRHQMSTYRSSQKSNYAYHRDLFLIQTALVVCRPAQILASIASRYGMILYPGGCTFSVDGADDQQKLEIAEDLVHLLISLLSDRTGLLVVDGDSSQKMVVTRRDIVHALCFKSLSYSEICNKMSERITDSEEFARLLDEMTTFRPPEGLADAGQFSLKDQYYEEIDPYLAWFSRNQRDEAETIYRKQVAQRLGKTPADVVFEPMLMPIASGLFTGLGDFVHTPLFVQIVYCFLEHIQAPEAGVVPLPVTKKEQFLSFLTHLILVATLIEDPVREVAGSQPWTSFSVLMLEGLDSDEPFAKSAAKVLKDIADVEAFKSCEPKIKLILKRLKERSPAQYLGWLASMDLPAERSNTHSPAPSLSVDKEQKKKQALERQARIMAQMKQQQANFMENQMDDWDDEDLTDSDMSLGEKVSGELQEQRTWKFPSGTCILCQEETNDSKLYGSFALISNSAVFRQTDFEDSDWVHEALETPLNLDESAEDIRPFGVAGQNKRTVRKITAEGRAIESERQELGKGFPAKHVTHGPVASGCGHIMHFSCFEVFLTATQRRHLAQIARNHPERVELKEFLCPLCKAIGNSFLPVIWKPKQLQFPGALKPGSDYPEFIEAVVPLTVKTFLQTDNAIINASQLRLFSNYAVRRLTTARAANIGSLSNEGNTYTTDGFVSIPRPQTIFGPGAQASHTLQIMFQNPVGAATNDNIFTSRQSPLEPREPYLPPTSASSGQEMIKIYQRLRDTMAANKIPTNFNHGAHVNSEDLTHTDAFTRCLGYSIAAVEIAQRGIAAESHNLIGSISSQTLTGLRILSESVTSYVAFGALRSHGNNNSFTESSTILVRQVAALFHGHPLLMDVKDAIGSPFHEPESRAYVVKQDSFVFLTELAEGIGAGLSLDIHHLMRLCYLAEVVRIMCKFFAATSKINPRLEAMQDSKDASLPRFASQIFNLGAHTPALQLYSEQDAFALLQRLVNSYALPYLRKCVIFMAVKYGVDFPREAFLTGNTELERLSAALRLPLPGQLLTETLDSPMTLQCVRGWMDSNDPTQIQLVLHHPAIYELVGLPKLFSTLQEEVMKRKCPRSGKDLSDPNLCLFCGELFCGQSVCCTTEDSKGGCWQHRQKCGGNIGMFINIRKCMVVFLNGDNGSWFLAPYLDKYGEVDPSLRRHQQLYLNQKRYDALQRHVWLHHQVQSTIARKLEGDSNTGGWETL